VADLRAVVLSCSVRKRCDADLNFSGAGAVELAEVDALPGAEEEFAFVDDEGDRGTGEDGFEMAITVAFGVEIEGFALGDEGGEFFGDVVFDVGVGVFVDGDGGGGVGDEDDAEAVLDAGLGDEFGDARGDVEDFVACAGGEFFGEEHEGLPK